MKTTLARIYDPLSAAALAKSLNSRIAGRRGYVRVEVSHDPTRIVLISKRRPSSQVLYEMNLFVAGWKAAVDAVI